MTAISDRFVRVPTTLLEQLIRMPLSGIQWRILLWTVRSTYGWNRSTARFSWYRIAKDIGATRPAVYRAGRTLMNAELLLVDSNERTVQVHPRVAGRQLSGPIADVAETQVSALLLSNAGVAIGHENRRFPATLYRRAKDTKDTSKKYKDKAARTNSDRKRRLEDGLYSGTRVAGAAHPVPGKYGGLSQH